MARVNRFIFNSDFMTIAKAGHGEANMTIPAGETGAGGASYHGTVWVDMDIPSGCFARARLKYTGSFRSIDAGISGLFFIDDTKNGKQILYVCQLVFKGGKVGIYYDVTNKTDTSQVLCDAQTVKLIIDFLKQPNT